MKQKRSKADEKRAQRERKPFVVPQLIHCGELERITMNSVPMGE